MSARVEPWIAMIKALLVVMRLIWTVLVVGAATLMGAVLGWGWHGWIGAIALGTVGFGLGALLAACPEVLLELLAEM
ncbi:hypothetical protein BraRD5C2_51700 [Bradyrhizobium sp. RD5-C2]|nr:hypothetical protein BraRD5C2_51700 [Bradyrhizobium sp. RD5-C2]